MEDTDRLDWKHGSIEREALGRIHSLGDLYDARNDTFTGVNIFKTKIPGDAISSTDNRFTEFKYTMSDGLEEKFKGMDIGGEMSVSILGGLVEGKGSASYLSDKKDSARSVRCSMYYKSKTKTESLNMNFDELTDTVSTSTLQDTKATHVVVGISWGANATFAFDYDNTEKLDRQEIEGAFHAHFDKMAVSVNGEARGDFKKGTKSTKINFKIHTFADITAPDEKIPTTPEEAQEFLRKMPIHVKEANDGKGKPLSYKLVPISIVQKRFSISIVGHLLVSLDEHVLIDFIRLFDELSEAKQRLYDLWLDIRNHKFCICDKDICKTEDAKEGLEKSEATLRWNFAKTVVAVRSGSFGEAGNEQLKKLRSEHSDGQYSFNKITSLLSSFSEITEKISFADFLVKNGVTYIGRDTSFECEMRKNMKGTVYILFFGTEDMNSKIWRKYQIFFTNLITPKKSDAKKVAASELETFLAVDLDLRKDIADKEEVGGGIRICKYRGGEYISYDLYADENKQTLPVPEKPNVDNEKTISELVTPCLQKPNVDNENTIPELVTPRLQKPNVDNENTIPELVTPRLQKPNVDNENTIPELVTPRLQKQLPTSGVVRGITSWNDELYVVTEKSPYIDVYDINTLDHRRKIRVKRLVNGWGIVAHANVLYVGESDDELIHRIKLSDESSSHWSVNSEWLTISINKKGNVVVSCFDLFKIIEYTPTGRCVRKIQVDEIDRWRSGLRHAIQLDDDRFLICAGAHHRVCIIDSKGRMMKSYGEDRGSGIGQMNLPYYLAIDRNGSILVADHNNNRIIQLNASLEFIGEFIPGSVGLKNPRRMHLHETMRRLYIAEQDKCYITIFDL